TLFRSEVHDQSRSGMETRHHARSQTANAAVGRDPLQTPEVNRNCRFIFNIFNCPTEPTMKHRSLAMRAALVTITLSPLCAWAAGTATITTGGESNTMAWLNSNTIRFDMPSTDGSYMISRDGKVYMVSPEAAGGMPPVMEIGGMMQGFG